MTLVQKPLEQMVAEIEGAPLPERKVIPILIKGTDVPPRRRSDHLLMQLVRYADNLVEELSPHCNIRHSLMPAPDPALALGALMHDIVKNVHDMNLALTLTLAPYRGPKGYVVHIRAHPSVCVDSAQEFPTLPHNPRDSDIRYLMHVADMEGFEVTSGRYRQSATIKVMV